MILDQQEADRAADMKRRDERNRKLLENAMAATGGPAKGFGGISKQEDAGNAEHEKALAAKRALEDEKKMKLEKERKALIKAALDEQVAEKKSRKKAEKVQNLQLADVWKKDQQIYEAQDDANMKKLKEVNKKHQEFLKQIDQALSRQKLQ